MCCNAHGKHPRCSATACRFKEQQLSINQTVVWRYVLQNGAGCSSGQAVSRMQKCAAVHTGSNPDDQPQHADVRSIYSASIKQ
jgi:hypothetical protein